MSQASAGSKVLRLESTGETSCIPWPTACMVRVNSCFSSWPSSECNFPDKSSSRLRYVRKDLHKLSVEDIRLSGFGVAVGRWPASDNERLVREAIDELEVSQFRITCPLYSTAPFGVRWNVPRVTLWVAGVGEISCMDLWTFAEGEWWALFGFLDVAFFVDVARLRPEVCFLSRLERLCDGVEGSSSTYR